MGQLKMSMNFGGRSTRTSHSSVSCAPNNMHSRLPGTWRRFNVPETVPGACSVAAYPARERCLKTYQRTTNAPAEIDVGLRTTLLHTKSQAHPCWSPGGPLPSWRLAENDPVARRSDPLTDLLSAGAYKDHLLSQGAAAPSYGYSADGIRSVPARFSYYCPPGNSEPAGPLFSHPYTHHLNGIAAPSRFAPAPAVEPAE